MKLLTISVAAYNMEPYIEETIRSLTDERIIDELEIFVVDDGGTDHTMDIVKGFAGRYPRSIIPVHKQNGGYGSTVNYSLQHATGKFFKLLDGDDWFDNEGLYQLVRLLETTEVDVIVTENVKEGTGEGDHKTVGDTGNGSITAEMKDVRFLNDSIVLGMGRLTYKTELLRRTGLTLPEHIFYTDTLFMAIPFTAAQTMLMTNIPVYHYRDERAGNSSSRASRIAHKNDMVQVLKVLAPLCTRLKAENHPLYEYICKVGVSIYHYAVKSMLFQTPSADVRREIKAFEGYMRSLSEEVYQSVARGTAKMCKLIWLLRKTDYYAYWIFGLVSPDRIKS